jgi:hypothetical protein
LTLLLPSLSTPSLMISASKKNTCRVHALNLISVSCQIANTNITHQQWRDIILIAHLSVGQEYFSMGRLHFKITE